MELKKTFQDLGAFVDAREEVRPGWKYSEWELKGIPLRLEVGPKDLEKKQVVIVRRDNGEKSFVSEKDLKKEVEKILEKMQSDLLEKSKKFLKENIEEAKTIQEMKKKVEGGKIVKAYFVEDKKTEEKIKEETGALSRIVEDVKKEGVCILTGKKTNTIGYFARNY
jgi:prolyl-tRNA synthetase